MSRYRELGSRLEHDHTANNFVLFASSLRSLRCEKKSGCKVRKEDAKNAKKLKMLLSRYLR